MCTASAGEGRVLANSSWPASLPAPLAAGTSSIKPTDDIIKSSVDAGLPKYRRRFTAVPAVFACNVLLTQAQVNTLEAFYSTTLNAVGLFNWTDYSTGLTATFGFTKRPSYQHVANTAGSNMLWIASLELERQP